MSGYIPTPIQYVPRAEEYEVINELRQVRRNGSSRALLLYGSGGIGKTSMVRRLAEHSSSETEIVWLEPIDVDDPESWLLSNLEARIARAIDPGKTYFSEYWKQMSRVPTYAHADISHETIVNYLGRVKKIFAESYARFVTTEDKTVVITFDTVETIRGTNLLLTLSKWMKALPKGTLFILSGRPVVGSRSSEKDQIALEIEHGDDRLPVKTIMIHEFGLEGTLTYLRSSEIGMSLRGDEEMQLALLSRGNPLWLAFLVDYLKQDGMPPEVARYSLTELELDVPFGGQLRPRGQHIHEEFLRRLVAPYQGADLLHESVKRLAVVRQPVAKSIWLRIMDDLGTTSELDEMWQSLLATSWIRARGNRQYIALHDALAEELAQRLFPLHDQDQRWRHRIWRKAYNAYSELASDAETRLGLEVSTLDEELHSFDRASNSPESSSSGSIEQLQQQVMSQAASLYSQRRELDMFRAASLYYLFLTDYEKGSQHLLASFRDAEQSHDSFFQDLLIIYLDRFLPGGTQSEAFNDVIKLKLEEFRTWLRGEKGRESYIDIGLIVGRYHVSRGQSQAALTVVGRLPGGASKVQRHGLDILQGNACMRIPSRVKEAQAHFDRAVATAEDLGTQDRHKLLAEAYKERGFFYRNTGQWQEADLAYRRAWEAISSGLSSRSPEEDRAELASVQTNWAYVLGLGGQYQEGLELADSAIVIRQQLGLRADEGLSWSVLGEVYRYGRMYAQAWQAYEAAERRLGSGRYADRMCFIYQEQAICLHQAYSDGIVLTENPDGEARRLIREALELATLYSIRGYPSALNRAGRIFGRSDPDMGLRYLELGIAEAERLSDGWFWLANLVEYAELSFRRWHETDEGRYRDNIDSRTRELNQVSENFSFPDLRGRWSLLQAHLAVEEYHRSGSEAYLHQALNLYESGFANLATRRVASSGTISIKRQFATLRDVFSGLPPEVAEEWKARLRSSWTGLGHFPTVTVLLARLEELSRAG